MTTRTEQVLERLSALGFETRLGSLSPFGDELPLVSGVAWEMGTAQLALVAEMTEGADDEAWRQLLFAGSGLRHHLVSDGPAAFGTPVILAIVDDAGERRLRLLTEDLVQHYALFRRVDLNIVRHADLERDDAALDQALAPLLPRCRTLLGQEIAKGEVQRFWAVLRKEVETAANETDALYSRFREAAGRSCADALIADDADSQDLPAPAPIANVRLHRFRSFEEAELTLTPVSIIYGTNGSGKSSVLEALELLWADTSQRKPSDVDATVYERHLPRNGNGTFVVASEDRTVSSVSENPSADLPRCVLNHDTAAGLVARSPNDRYAALLKTTGLEIPDLRSRTAQLVETTKHAADAALRSAGLPTLPRKDSNATTHLKTSLAMDLASRLPSVHDLVGIERELAEGTAPDARYQPRDWPTEQGALDALVEADAVVAKVLSDSPPSDEEAAAVLDHARRELRVLATPRREASTAVRRLLDAIERLKVPRQPSASAIPPTPPAAVPASLAVRWLAHANSISDAGVQFRAEAERITDAGWSAALSAYADALAAAARIVPRARLEPLTRSTKAARPDPTPTEISSSLYSDAGFTRPASDPGSLATSLRQLDAELRRQVDVLAVLESELAGHPARSFAGHADNLLRALCCFELARILRREGPILRASEALVSQLLQGRLAPAVRELVAAIVRFEWYFKPLQVPQAGRSIVFGGLSTAEPNLDARLVLNAAERSVVGLAWFLALHLLQPEERRQVLVLDDPTAAFDSLNQAGFVSTLRAFVRLTRPQQIVVTSHDEAVASLLADELAPVDGWPSAVTRIRCYRDPDDCSVAEAVVSNTPRAVSDEASRLGLVAAVP